LWIGLEKTDFLVPSVGICLNELARLRKNWM